MNNITFLTSSKLILIMILSILLISCGSNKTEHTRTASHFVGSRNAVYFFQDTVVNSFNLTLDNNLSGTFSETKNQDFTYFISGIFFDESVRFTLYASDLNEGDNSPFNLDAACIAFYSSPSPRSFMDLYCEEIGCDNHCSSAGWTFTN